MTGRTQVLAGCDTVIGRLETLNEPDTADMVRQLRRVYIAETGHLERVLAQFSPVPAAVLGITVSPARG